MKRSSLRYLPGDFLFIKFSWSASCTRSWESIPEREVWESIPAAVWPPMSEVSVTRRLFGAEREETVGLVDDRPSPSFFAHDAHLVVADRLMYESAKAAMASTC